MRLRCLLIDNEPPALKNVPIRYISEIYGRGIVDQCRNAIETLGGAIAPESGEIIFNDIKMPYIVGTDF